MNSQDNLRAQLSRAVKAILDRLEDGGVALPGDLRRWKTFEYYEKVLNRNVRDLYSGEMTEAEFVDDLARLIDEQFTRAFNEGMKLNDLDPAKDMTPEWEDALQERKLTEFDFVDNYAAEIVKAAAEEGDIRPFQDRASMWANRYNEIVSWAQMITRPEDRYIWKVGPTEHCKTCDMLDGIVATGKDWTESGYRPQGDMLECGGFRCQCSLEYTEEKATEGGIP